MARGKRGKTCRQRNVSVHVQFCSTRVLYTRYSQYGTMRALTSPPRRKGGLYRTVGRRPTRRLALFLPSGKVTVRYTSVRPVLYHWCCTVQVVAFQTSCAKRSACRAQYSTGTVFVSPALPPSEAATAQYCTRTVQHSTPVLYSTPVPYSTVRADPACT